MLKLRWAVDDTIRKGFEMRIATVGTGGIGGFLAVKLANAGHEVITIARGAHLEAIRAQGLQLQSETGTEIVHPALATDSTDDVGPVDAIIFGVKGDALGAAAKTCLPMIGPDTVVVPFLNGVEAAERLAQILPVQSVANGVAWISTTISAPGVIKQTGDFHSFIFAERDNRSSARIEALRDAINASGSSAPDRQDIDKELWSKFVLFAALSGVTAAGRCTVGDIRSIPELASLFKSAVSETARIGRAHGVALDADIEEQVWSSMMAFPPQARASTAIDLEHGRPLEIDWVSGAAVRLAAEVGMDAPVNSALYAVLLPHKRGR
ncbi:2-dehydropantoate 2-reductase [Marivita sp. XM-24bin2]|jgi:2-dehydropantoate 2-reductase|uniref:ketopantoate reductase family protein n=1 Tax=unclassified Marivita TaxID=2632480 RepID=UPI000D7ADE8A|nr:2-dehydropantoate 2-reductase [Marivita sp. XM-24bin2]MCR9109850.1 2-dehydropantoate 2-reductase [Paracoccaceae bacterium]PWL36669.1 MAG: 2-dehydropantoate 2-reductase [Marivita sp. XM-24bin2]